MSTSRSRMRESAKQGRDRQQDGDEEHRAARQEIAGRAHHGGRNAIAERGKARVAPEPLADRGGPTSPRLIAAIAGPSTQLAAACSVAAAITTERSASARRRARCTPMVGDRKARDQPLGAGGIDERAARHLADQRDDAADRQHQADLDLRPFLRRQIDRDERPEAGLHVGEKEDEPVEAAQALARGMPARRAGCAAPATACALDAAAARARIGSAARSERGRANRLLLRASLTNCSGCRLPDAPSTTIGLSSLYSGAAFTCSRVSSSVMLSLLLAIVSEPQRVPVDHDLAAADAEKAAEIDHGGAHRARRGRR